MRSSAIRRFLLAATLILPMSSFADDSNITVPMHDKGMSTYYVPAQIADLATSELMVDTGSGYLTINQQTLSALQARQQVEYVKELRAILANGAEMVIPIYTINELRVGSCIIRNVEAAVFPGHTRQILGLSALNKAAPFVFSVDPPKLVLSNCVKNETTLTSPAVTEAAAPKEMTGNNVTTLQP